MKTEYEVVFMNINIEEMKSKIKSLGGKLVKENTLMKRVVFEVPGNKRGSYLRVRDEGDKITCTYKEEKSGDLDIHSISELETMVGDFQEMVNIFRKLGLKEKSYQETYREVWEIDHEIEIMLDIWPGLNPYIEIEGENEKVVKKYCELLGFDYDNGIFGSSFQIYEKELGLDYDYINSLKEITFENPPKRI
ncbi:MAG: class IV adenylate cyclase [Candidatus Gracilibacteria bacterium]|nr:class IV adenylate cyclase [Candidatus Gracilibacteria bacterium]